MANFMEKLARATLKNESLLCVGLDPDPLKLPEGVAVTDFNREIINATADLACAYKLNLAFYEALGDGGTHILKQTISHIPTDIPVIGDAKRGDIGNTARAYAKAIFDYYHFDATTVSPYLGFDSLEPFIQYQERGIFVLCRTSNAGAVDFQSLRCRINNGEMQLFEMVARKVSEWNVNGNLGLVVGATYPEELQLIRRTHPGLPLLIPGVGAQGGDLAMAVQYGVDENGQKALINSSRQILYASRDKDFAPAARKAAQELRDQMNSFLPQKGG